MNMNTVAKAAREFRRFPFVIIGAGPAGWSAIKAIRETDKDSEILVIGGEDHTPYTRTPLSKQLWKNKDPKSLRFTDFDGNESSIELDQAKFYASENRITLLKATKATLLDPSRKVVTLDNGTEVQYDKCLLSTGARPRLIPSIPETRPNITTYRTISDFMYLNDVCQKARHITIIGGGFLGSELAFSLALERAKTTGMKISQVFPDPGILAKVLPTYLANHVTSKAREAGIDVHTGRHIQSVNEDGGRLVVTLDNNDKITTDHIVVCTGIEPNTELAVKAGLPIGPTTGGVTVSLTMECGPGIYAAGDVCSWTDRIVDEQRRVDHHDHAVASGRVAGQNMTGSITKYDYQPMIWSDLGNMGFEGVGLVDSRLESVGVWCTDKHKDPLVFHSQSSETPADFDFQRGFIYYLRSKHIVGAVMWGVFGKVDEVRAIIQRKLPIEDIQDCSKLISFREPHQVSSHK